MKKLKLMMMTGLMLLSILPVPVKAINIEPISAPVPVPIPTESQILVNRIAEIKAMDKSKLSSTEKKQLRQELRQMKSNKKALNGGVYLSVGSIIIIVLLLILLL